MFRWQLSMRFRSALGLHEKLRIHVLHCISAALLVSGPCPYSPTSSYTVWGMNAQVLTSFSLCLPTVKVLLGPSHRHLGDVSTGVLAPKFLVSMNGLRAMHRATMSLNLATPGHQPVDEVETCAFSPGWDTDMAQRLVMWATAFLLHMTDTSSGPCWVVHCLGSAVAVLQRCKHSRSLISTEDTHNKIPLRFSRGFRGSMSGRTGSTERGQIFAQDRAVHAP